MNASAFPNRRKWGEGGYVLLAVLWLCAGIIALAGSLAAVAREATAASRNRIGLERAEWLALGCAALAQASLREALSESALRSDVERRAVWQRVDSVLVAVHHPGCTLTAFAVGEKLNLNAIDEEQARRLLLALGASPPFADSAAAALLDWRDEDDETRPNGAEAAWYRAMGRPSPPNRPFYSVQEVGSVRGMNRLESLRDHVGLHAGAVSINHATEPVLAALPGFTPEGAAAVMAARRKGQWVSGFGQLLALFSHDERDLLLGGLPDLMAAATFEPEGWIVTVLGVSGHPPVSVKLEMRFVRNGDAVSVPTGHTRIQ